MKLFISGWAGFKEALQIPEDWHFIIPFLDYDEEGILNFLKNKSGSIAIGWSTGGHIVLKQIDFFAERFEKIIIIAGFKKFTDYVNPKIINRMINKMQSDPETVVRDFLINAGCKPFLPENINKDALIEGLRFLLKSEISVFTSYKNILNLSLFHGSIDKILPPKALYDLKNLFPSAELTVIDAPHWISLKHLKIYIPK